MATKTRLNTFVHVADDEGATHVFGPDDENIPGWAKEKITNPAVWASEDGSAAPAVGPGATRTYTEEELAERARGKRPDLRVQYDKAPDYEAMSSDELDVEIARLEQAGVSLGLPGNAGKKRKVEALQAYAAAQAGSLPDENGNGSSGGES